MAFRLRHMFPFVMAGLGPAIHAFLFVAAKKKPVDGPDKPGHDELGLGVVP